MSEFEMQCPPGYRAVEHADGVVHAIDLDDLPDDGPTWRAGVVCGTGTGVSSDEGGLMALDHTVITCWQCIGILDTGPALPPAPPSARPRVTRPPQPAARRGHRP